VSSDTEKNGRAGARSGLEAEWKGEAERKGEDTRGIKKGRWAWNIKVGMEVETMSVVSRVRKQGMYVDRQRKKYERRWEEKCSSRGVITNDL